jgi:hypothetical protein
LEAVACPVVKYELVHDGAPTPGLTRDGDIVRVASESWRNSLDYNG